MKSTLFHGMYLGGPRACAKGTLKPGRLVQIAHVTGDGFDYWEAAPLRMRAEDCWPQVDRLDLVIPNHEITRAEFERALAGS